MRSVFSRTALMLLILLLGGCVPPPEPGGTLHVFAAASLTEAFGEIGTSFEASHPRVAVVYNFAGSQQLAQQIIEGAPADVFASASGKQMDALIAAERVAGGASQVFARNRLVVILPAKNPAGVSGLADLARPGMKLAFAAPQVPVGQYSLEFLEKAALQPEFGAGYKDAVLHNVVSQEENVKAVVAKVALGEADAGIVYVSDLSGDSGSGVGRLEIPDKLNVIASYPIAPVAGGANAALAREFVEFVLSPRGQEVLIRHGFLPPG